MEQEYIIENIDSFEPKDIFECGQCFRWNKEIDNSYTGVIGNNILNVKKIDNKVVFKGNCSEDIKDIINRYFNLEIDYKDLKDKLSKIDEYMKTSIEYGQGIRILNQDLWETIISFIISANNNIPRIKGIIERISCKYGRKIEYNSKEYYTFPSIEELSKASIEDLRGLGLGFRDKRVYEVAQIFKNGEMTIDELINEKNTDVVKEKLLTLPGVGPKVADCILLFSLNRYEVFPIDVWVRRVMNELYIHNENEESVSKQKINELAKEKYGNLAGIAQQYLFYWKRES